MTIVTGFVVVVGRSEERFSRAPLQRTDLQTDRRTDGRAGFYGGHWANECIIIKDSVASKSKVDLVQI